MYVECSYKMVASLLSGPGVVLLPGTREVGSICGWCKCVSVHCSVPVFFVLLRRVAWQGALLPALLLSLKGVQEDTKCSGVGVGQGPAGPEGGCVCSCGTGGASDCGPPPGVGGVCALRWRPTVPRQDLSSDCGASARRCSQQQQRERELKLRSLEEAARGGRPPIN